MKKSALTPQTQPLVQPSDVTYLGTLRLPAGVGNPNGLGIVGDLMYVCTYGGGTTGIAQVRIPVNGIGQATIVDGTKPLPNTIQLHRGGTYNDVICGGVLPRTDGSIVASGWNYYDGGGGQWKSHWFGQPSVMQGPFTMEVSDVGMYGAGPIGGAVAMQAQTKRGGAINAALQAELDKAPSESFVIEPKASTLVEPLAVSWYREAMIGGYMGHVPPEWQVLFGGSGLSGQCSVPIIFRTSSGPCVSVFDPATVDGRAVIPSKMLCGYPYEHATLGKWEASPPGQFYGASDQLGSVAFPPGTRSVLFTGRHGDTNCYGPATNNPALVGTKCNPTSAYNCCFDPYDAMQGNHGAPYRPSMWAYDANDLLKVKQGTLKPWDVAPYARFDLPGLTLTQPYYLRAGFFDPATMRYYVGDNGSNIIHVFKIGVGSPPTPTDCVGSYGTPTFSTWTACNAAGVQTRVKTTPYNVTTPASGGGTPCLPTLTVTETQPCPPSSGNLIATATVVTSNDASVPVGATLKITIE